MPIYDLDKAVIWLGVFAATAALVSVVLRRTESRPKWRSSSVSGHAYRVTVRRR